MPNAQSNPGRTHNDAQAYSGVCGQSPQWGLLAESLVRLIQLYTLGILQTIEQPVTV